MEQPGCVHAVRDQSARGWIASGKIVTLLATGAEVANTRFNQCRTSISELRLLNVPGGTDTFPFERLARQFQFSA